MISRDEAIEKLKVHWETKKFVFQADFHIPQNVILRDGSKPFGYFRNIRLNGEIIEYPLETHEKRISIFHIIKKGLVDGKQYEVELDLSNDQYRNKNPYSMIVKRFKPLETPTANSDTNLEKTINEIFQENININSPFQVVNLANSVESLATDIYSEDKRFIYELIQNADDAALDEDSELSISILENYVVISHNGAPFNSRDIRGLCSIGLGTKTNDATKTGYKGIGFKSVFGQPEGIVYVKTENTLFRFDREYAKQKGWNPKWGNQKTWEEKYGVVFNCPWQMMPILSNNTNDNTTDSVLNNKRYSVKTAIKINNSKILYNNINSFFGDAKFLLFLRKISKVTLKYQQHKLELQKIKSVIIENMVTLQSNQKNISNWYVRNWVHNIPKEIQSELKSDPKTPKKIQDMEKTEISFAINVNESFDKITLLEHGSSPLYSYLPTTVKEYNIPFIVNCNFLLDASREKIHKNRKWNEWLFQVIGYKTVECSSEFLSNNLFEDNHLSVFRNGLVSETDNLCKKINEGLRIGLDKFTIIQDRNNKFCKLKEVLLDPFDLHKVDARFPDTFASFLNDTQEGFHVKGSNLIVLTDRNEVLKKLDVKVINEIQLQNFLSSKLFSRIITKGNNASVLNFLRPFELNDASGKWYTAVTNNKLIINQDGELDFITKVCFPITIDTENEFKNTLINSEVNEAIKPNKELIEWLEKLGVTDPGSIAYLEKEIIGRIENCINTENYLKITKFIFDLHTDNRLKTDHYVNLQELPLKTSRGFKKANQTVLSIAYNPTTDFTKVLPKEAYLEDDYLKLSSPHECKIFFKLLNVVDDIEFIKSSKKLSYELPVEYVNISNSFAKDGHNYPHLIGVFHPNLPSLEVPYYLQSFSFLEHSNKLNFSELFWERVFDKYHLTIINSGTSPRNYCPEREYTNYNLGQGLILSTLDEMNWGRYPGNRTKVPGYLFWYFQHIKCIPTCTGLQLAKDTFTNSEYVKELAGEYLPVFKVKTVVPEDWCRHLKLKTKFSLNDLLYILDKVSFNLKSQGFINKEDEKRIGLIINEFLSRLEIDPENTTRILNDWAINHDLISSSKKNTSPDKLLYINIKGFENSITGIETIFIPKNVDTKHPFFEKLLKTFRVKIIDSFSYQAENEKACNDLQIKLLKLIGPITLMLKNKMVINDLDRSLYERFFKISNTDFIRCNSIRPVFVHETEEFEGDVVMYHYDEAQNNFLISESWNSPSVILNISYHLSKLLSAVRLEKEIMMMLNMNERQIVEYLISLGINIEEYNTSSISKDIIQFIQELENKTIAITNPIVVQSLSDNSNTSYQEEGSDKLSKSSESNSDETKKEDTFIKEVEDFISNELEGTEWEPYIIELKKLLRLDINLAEQKKKVYNLLAKLKLAKFRNIHFESVNENDRQFNYLEGNGEKYIVHSARGSFAYIAPVELLKMRDEGYMMALDFGNKTPIKIYHIAEEILSLNTNHLLLYQSDKTMEELFAFCENNQSANKRLLIIDKDHASNKSKELLKLMIPDEEY
jgi:hypothetical protein